ncbi:MAG TPA: SGNH hydrolase domain-containing protein [Candidatus Limnocylindrales bacterium]|nr:SGNH hydrolase domain-containing protein [Candidatus Limnocylindrales bacterium]
MASPPPSDGRAPFRPDIEGLRAVAVLLVLAYHARIPGFPGGYIGVDVFYVVSGFLITGLIVRELQATGRVDLVAFYARRLRRLLPAALVVIALTVIASAIVLPPLRVPDVAADGAAAALYVSNIRFAAQATDYLQAELDPSPLLHFWSLGVEEQFYLFWPALLLVVAGRRTDIRRIGLVVAIVALLSFALGIAWTESDAPLAFFLLPARAWELAAGAALAIGVTRLSRLPTSFATVAVGAGLASILIGAVVFDTDTPFPGTAALLPVLGAALVIAGGIRQPLNRVSRLVAIRPMRWIGGISYSLYLWHWPLLVLPAAAVGSELPWPATLGLVALTFVLAEASRRWIEDPIRHGRVAKLRPSRSIGVALASSVVVATVSLGLGVTAGPPAVAGSIGNATGSAAVDLDLPTPLPSSAIVTATNAPATPSAEPTLAPTPAGPVPVDLVPPLATVRQDLPVIYADECHAEWKEVAPPTCVYGRKDGKTVFLIGDSHAAHWFPTFQRLANEQDWRLVSLTKSACPVADVAVYNGTLKREYTECDTWRAAVLDRISREKPAMVVVSDSRIGQLWVDGTPVPYTDREDLWATGLERSLDGLRRLTDHLVVIGDTPRPAKDAPVCVSDHLDNALACATPLSQAIAPAWTATERTVSGETGATFIDPTAWLCPTVPCPAVIGKVLVYRDGHHMTTPFARALAPYLEPLLPKLGG